MFCGSLARKQSLSMTTDRRQHFGVCVGSTVMVTPHGFRHLCIHAIGEPATLAETLRNPAYLVMLRQKVERYGIKLQVAQVSKVDVAGVHWRIFGTAWQSP